MDYQPGQYFGERALLMNEARAATICVTSESCTVLSLDRGAFQRLLGPLDKILMRNMDQYKKFSK
jgi:cAMP-dependent protein kinase regulator